MASIPDTPPAQENPDFAELSIAVVAGLALALTVLFIFTIPVAGNLAASRDFVSYWAAGQQLVHHADPYDREAVSALEHSAGFSYSLVLIMRNPPWALPLAFPLGFLGLRLAAVLWTLLLLACLLVSVHLVHQLYGSPPNRIHWLGLAFTPALICLTMGQTSLFACLDSCCFFASIVAVRSLPVPHSGSAPSSLICSCRLPQLWPFGSCSRAAINCWPVSPPPSPSVAPRRS